MRPQTNEKNVFILRNNVVIDLDSGTKINRRKNIHLYQNNDND